MYAYLWQPGQGMFAEYRDLLGLQRAHPAAALWTFYHPLDAPGLVDTVRASSMTRWVRDNLPHIPVRGAGVDTGLHVLATSSWMPYSWSINNVVFGENMHAALGHWQASQDAEAFTLFRSAVFASMYMGISPGNVGTLNYLDVYRRESQRDFADGAGTMSRALVEGLFGIHPDALAGEITFAPAWPADWPFASLTAPSEELKFDRDSHRRDRYRVTADHEVFRHALLRLPLRSLSWKVTSAARTIEAALTRDALGRQFLEISFPIAGPKEITVEWSGADAGEPGVVLVDDLPASRESPAAMPDAIPDGVPVPVYNPIDLAPWFNDRVTRIFAPDKYRSPRSPFVSLALPAQGIGAWAGHVNATAEIDDSGLRKLAGEHGGRFTLPGGVPFALPVDEVANVIFTSQWDNYPRKVSLPLHGHARRIALLMAGSTNYMQSRIDNGEVLVEYTDGSRERLPLHNPTNWWPIEQDYFIDDFQFRRPEAIPTRVDLKTGRIRQEDPEAFKGKGGVIPGGAATVLELSLDPTRELRSLTVSALSNEVVIGLMAATLIR
jgi:hypothetical protein